MLERLIDRDPKSSSEAPPTRAQSVRLLKSSLRRDLEWLLNTRRTPEAVGREFHELEQSLYHYGLPDITSASSESTDTRHWLRRQVEETIRVFEPRLTDVHVSVEAVGDLARREVRFVVEALLQMEPSPEQVVFDTVLEISSATFEVKGAGADA